MKKEDLNYYQFGYISFLLGADDFVVSKKIRELAKEYGTDTMFESCEFIVKQFLVYDKRNENIMGEYESFTKFLDEYTPKIMEFLEQGKAFFVGEEENGL